MGDTEIFASRPQYRTTVDEMLADTELMAYNDAAQVRIDTVRLALQDAFSLTDDDFVEVPVLFEDLSFGFAVALNPGVQNLITDDDALFLPDPEGPIVAGVDQWRKQSIDAVERTLGLTAIFVDVFYSYHVQLGEAHCGSAMVREPFDDFWWQHDNP